MPSKIEKHGAEPRPGEVYLEFIRLGNAVKVTAVDAASGHEVSVMGPSTATPDELKRIAVRKLENRLAAIKG